MENNTTKEAVRERARVIAQAMGLKGCPDCATPQQQKEHRKVLRIENELLSGTWQVKCPCGREGAVAHSLLQAVINWQELKRE